MMFIMFVVYLYTSRSFHLICIKLFGKGHTDGRSWLILEDNYSYNWKGPAQRFYSAWKHKTFTSYESFIESCSKHVGVPHVELSGALKSGRRLKCQGCWSARAEPSGAVRGSEISSRLCAVPCNDAVRGADESCCCGPAWRSSNLAQVWMEANMHTHKLSDCHIFVVRTQLFEEGYAGVLVSGGINTFYTCRIGHVTCFEFC